MLHPDTVESPFSVHLCSCPLSDHLWVCASFFSHLTFNFMYGCSQCNMKLHPSVYKCSQVCCISTIYVRIEPFPNTLWAIYTFLLSVGNGIGTLPPSFTSLVCTEQYANKLHQVKRATRLFAQLKGTRVHAKACVFSNNNSTFNLFNYAFTSTGATWGRQPPVSRA